MNQKMESVLPPMPEDVYSNSPMKIHPQIYAADSSQLTANSFGSGNTLHHQTIAYFPVQTEYMMNMPHLSPSSPQGFKGGSSSATDYSMLNLIYAPIVSDYPSFLENKYHVNQEQTSENTNEDDVGECLPCSFPGCTKTFKRHQTLRAHQSTHAENRQFSCQECGSGFRRLPDLQRHHRSVHTGSRPFICPQGCGKSFSRKDALKRHLECKSSGVPCAGFRR